MCSIKSIRASVGPTLLEEGCLFMVPFYGCCCLLQAVSTDHAGMVCCWDLTTGRLHNSFSNTHGSCRISTAAFDASHRRLITGVIPLQEWALVRKPTI